MHDLDLLFAREKADRLRVLLNSSAWLEDFVPEILRSRANTITLLLDPTLTRRENFSDDYLRARIIVLDELLNIGRGFLEEYDAARQAAEEAAANEVQYQDRADLGHMGPFAQSYP